MQNSVDCVTQDDGRTKTGMVLVLGGIQENRASRGQKEDRVIGETGKIFIFKLFPELCGKISMFK